MTMKSLLSPRNLLSLIPLLGLSSAAYAQTPTLTVSPSVITNDYVGKIVLTISSLTPGKKVIVQRYSDVNTNEIVDAQDWLVQAFAVSDGTLPLIGGVRNINMPGDEDGATNGQIRVELYYPGLNAVLDHIAGQYLFQVTDPQGVFSPVTASFSVLQKAYPQGVSGTVYSAGSGQPLANAAVLLVQQKANGGTGTFADANGNFALGFVPGSYSLLAFKDGFAADQSVGVTLNSNSFSAVNLTNPVSSQWLSGSVSDSGSGKGLPGIFVEGSSTNNLMMIGFTDTNGGFNLPVPAGQWKLKVSSDGGLALGGYVGFQNNSLTAYTFGGSVSNLNFQFPKGTAMVYGQVTDNLSNVVSGLEIDGQDGSYTYDTRGVTITNGTYAVTLFAGNWTVGPSPEALIASGLLGQSTNVTITNGQALLANLQVQRPTAHLRGRVVDGNGYPVGNQSLVVFLTNTNGGPPLVNLNPQTLGDGTFDVGVFGGQWNLGLECTSAASRGLVVPYIIVNVTDGVDHNNLTLLAPFVTGYISGSIRDNHGNPVSANTYASLSINGTNYTACGGNGGSTFLLPVFNGTWSVGISGDLTSLGYDNPPYQSVPVSGGTNLVTIILYPLGQTPPRLISPSYVNGQFQFTLSGDVGQSYRVDTTTNLNNPASWVSLRTNIAYGGTFTFTDNNAQSIAPRYYRAVRMP
jgi:hypothetical protein